MTATAAAPARQVGPLLRDWRRRRRLSQMDLALEAGVSTRHLSFVETGRSRPSREMVLWLAEQLDVPLRDRNLLLLAAGYAPAYAQRSLDDPDLAPVREAVQLTLTGHEPCPALAVDRAWTMLAANDALAVLLDGVNPNLLEPPVNALRVSLHPDGMAPRIANLAEWREHVLDRLTRHVATTGDPATTAVLDELSSYPVPEDDGVRALPGQDLVVPLRLRTPGGELTFLSTITTFGTAIDITVAELSIETFLPADDATARALRG